MALTCCEKGTPAVTGDKGLVVVKRSGAIAAAMVKLNGTVVVWCVGAQESVAVTLIVKVPVPVGVPESKPLVERLRPAGTPVAVQVTLPVPPEFANWNEDAEFCVACGKGLVLVIARGTHDTVTLRACVAVPAMLSVTLATKLKVPVAVGVPDKTPALLNDVPGGTVPERTENVYGGVPPLATIWSEIATPSVAFGRLVVVIVSGPEFAAMVSEAECEMVCAVGKQESVTWKVNGNTPVAVGVPLITPVEVLKLRPVGNEPVRA